MLVCLCRGVRDAEIERCRLRGATSADQVASECGAGADCGICRDRINELLSAPDGPPYPPGTARPEKDCPPVVPL